MLSKNPKKKAQIDMFRSKLSNIINMSHELVTLGEQIDWEGIYNDLLPLYSTNGRPSISPRQIVGLLMLKRMFNESDETVVERWIENPYWQFFTGEEYFQNTKPFDPSEFVHFRKRIGEKGFEDLLSYTVKLHKGATQEKEVLVDTTVQEKNITFPTDTKLAKRIIEKCHKIARDQCVRLRRSYAKELKQLMKDQYNGHHPRRRKKANKARKRIKTIALTLIRELGRKLEKDDHKEQLTFFNKVLNQKKNDKNKVYSLHELNVFCIAKGKVHKKYEFGNKVSVILGAKTGIITSVKSYVGNPHDSKTLTSTLEQSQRVREKAGGSRPKVAIADRGYRGVKNVGQTQIVIPDSGIGKSKYQKEKARKRFRKRAGIEPIIGHLKHDHRMIRNYLKGMNGDIANALLAGIGFNLKKMLNIIKANPALRQSIIQYITLWYVPKYRKVTF